MKRRDFLRGAALLAGGFTSSEAFAADNSDSVKFSVFADMHFRVGNYNWTVERMAQILDRARKNRVDFIIHCGDLCHNVKTAAPILDQYNNFELPHYHVMGNHDFEATKTLEDVVNAYQMKDGNFYSFDRGAFRFVVLDTNYFRRPDGSIMHYASSTAYEKCHQKEAIVTPEQVAMLREKISTAKGPCVVFSHHGFKYTSGITNAAEVKKAVCGGTTSQIVARHLGTKVDTVLDFVDKDIPPIGHIDGIDVTTEGVITLRRLLELAEKYNSTSDLSPKYYDKKDGASLLANLLFEQATSVHFLVGQSANIAHKGLPIDITMKLKLVERLADNLRRMGKRVEIEYN